MAGLEPPNRDSADADRLPTDTADGDLVGRDALPLPLPGEICTPMVRR